MEEASLTIIMISLETDYRPWISRGVFYHRPNSLSMGQDGYSHGLERPQTFGNESPKN